MPPDDLPPAADLDRCGAAYLASEGNEAVLAEELARRGARIAAWHGRLALSPDPPVQALWALDCWTAPELVEVPSIGTAVAALRDRQRNWSLEPVGFHRRSALIAERLPPVKAAPLKFPMAAPAAPLGAWTLLAPDRLLLSTTKTSPFPNGIARFIEDRVGPPSRAYLKLWEACARLGVWPQPGETCLDLGATPGGWTWAIASLGAGVTAVDRAPLDPTVAAMPGVTFRRESAFGLDPANEPAVDWLFSDVIAYPERLLVLVQRWILAGKAARIVCTIKFQDPTDHDAADAFAAIPGGRVLHLSHNKHELTFLWCR
ncbi:SAM-dependent methyltransferase [Lichenicola sp.]|uniref:SAM-dependent methyltransferase n=1 Tax=Lichenicola sp. TaxID=2804529 RepID=UPI003AFFE3F6